MENRSTVLGVDDKPENLVALRAILDDLDCDFISCHSGQQALEFLLNKEVALILMDVMMPGMDGYETAELIRGRKITRHIPIIFISAINETPEHVFKGYNSGAVDYLFKPFQPEILLSKVKIFLELYQQQRSLLDKANQLEQANEQILLQQKILLESKLRFSTAFEQSFQFMAILDSHGKVVELNRLAKKLCGDFNGQVIGQYIWNVCWVGQHEENERLKKAVLAAAGGECISDEAQFKDVEGELHFLIRLISPVKNEDGEVLYITVQGHDISEKVQAEQDKKNMEQLLQQAQKMEALGTLAGGIAHDFNNVLAVIIGNADLAGNTPGNERQQKQFIKRILTASHKAKDLVKQILAFSREAEIEKTLVNPRSVLLETVKLLRASIPTTISIVHRIDKECGEIWADPTQYHQIIMNLCTNAFHAMEENGGELTVTLTRKYMEKRHISDDLESGFYVCLTVRDSGHGISHNDMEKIFDPYFTTKTREKGTGMGLSIVHGIVKGHGGFMEVESAEGKGSAFTVYLPVSSEGKCREERSFESLVYGNEHILIVDDEEQLLEMTKNMLEALHYTVDTESSSRNALKIFSQNPEGYDLVVTDQTMPDMTGTELAKKILHIRSNTPIILCTGYSPDITADKIRAMGIRELAFKPLALEEMSKIVRSALDGRD